MADHITGATLFYALVGGFFPALLWLYFWLKEDMHPEPRGLLMLSFIFGMIAVPVAIFLEKFSVSSGLISLADTVISKKIFLFSLPASILIWSAIEESLKYLAVSLGPFRTRFFDEPIDAAIYLITAALGFAALENTLFLIGALQNGGFAEWFATGNSRFIGATVLHTTTSSLIGISLGLSFYQGKIIRFISLLLGLSTAILLHAWFNFYIIKSNGNNIFEIFVIVWGVVILTLLAFEKIRRARPRPRTK